MGKKQDADVFFKDTYVELQKLAKDANENEDERKTLQKFLGMAKNKRKENSSSNRRNKNNKRRKKNRRNKFVTAVPKVQPGAEKNVAPKELKSCLKGKPLEKHESNLQSDKLKKRDGVLDGKADALDHSVADWGSLMQKQNDGDDIS